jgi:hypothetical protein
MKHLVIAAVVAAMLCAGARLAEAKTYRSDGGGSSHASGPHRTSHTHAAKSKSKYVIVKCKTKACLKKHPSGVYGFVPKAKKAP